MFVLILVLYVSYAHLCSCMIRTYHRTQFPVSFVRIIQSACFAHCDVSDVLFGVMAVVDPEKIVFWGEEE